MLKFILDLHFPIHLETPLDRSRKLFVFLLFIAAIPALWAQDTTAIDSTKDKVQYKPRFRGLPVVYYRPETKLAFGAAAMISFKPGPCTFNTRTSFAQAYILYTLNQQVISHNRFFLITNNDLYFLHGKLVYNRFPQDYYGIGNNTSEDDAETVDYQRWQFDAKAMRRVSSLVYVGLRYRFSKLYNVIQTTGGSLETEQPSGWDGYRVSGFGVSLAYDSRDNVINPSRGAFLEVSEEYSNSIFGSQHNFHVIKFDFRKFVEVWPKHRHILALQAYGEIRSGDVPFMELSALGGSDLMRGYYRGRYLDKNYLAAQAEYRFPVWRWFSMVAWVGGGDVAHRMGAFRLRSIKYNFGMGIRIRIDKKENVNIRVDHGRGKGTNGSYLDAGEAF